MRAPHLPPTSVGDTVDVAAISWMSPTSVTVATSAKPIFPSCRRRKSTIVLDVLLKLS